VNQNCEEAEQCDYIELFGTINIETCPNLLQIFVRFCPIYLKLLADCYDLLRILQFVQIEIN
jgi:hypothetical protein